MRISKVEVIAIRTPSAPPNVEPAYRWRVTTPFSHFTAAADLVLDRLELFTSGAARDEAHDAFRRLRGEGRTVRVRRR